uniref:Glutathione S-transferase kappa n=1 Tax=Spongospora subterranea TaxID=70186 RepID=A0A0H5RAR8_9EUKA|eukprot:CRZ10866.1 hypothetical protein [Spongospora subterranea]
MADGSGAAGKITMYFDVVSPFSYLAWLQLRQIESAWTDVQICLRPFKLGQVVRATKNVVPGAVPAKAKWAYIDLQRAASAAGISPIRMPAVFPFPTDNVLRFLSAFASDPPSLMLATGVFYNAIFTQGRAIVTPEDIRREIGTSLPSDVVETALRFAASPESRSVLKKTTEDALAAGAFGAPTIIVDVPNRKSQFFFGSDRFHQIAALFNRPLPDQQRAML